MVVPICGTTPSVGHALSSVFGRRASCTVRIVLVSSKDGSGSVRVVGAQGRTGVALLQRGGRKPSTTHGGKVGATRNHCYTCLSTSSC